MIGNKRKLPKKAGNADKIVVKWNPERRRAVRTGSAACSDAASERRARVFPPAPCVSRPSGFPLANLIDCSHSPTTRD